MTTVIAVRRNGETMIGSDGTAFSGSRICTLGLEKVYKFKDNWLIGGCGWTMLNFELLKVLEDESIIIDWSNKDELTIKEQTLLCEGLEKRVKHSDEEGSFILWSKKVGYQMSLWVGKEGEKREMVPSVFMRKIVSDHFVIGSGSIVAETCYRILVKHKPKIKNEELIRECLLMAGEMESSTTGLDLQIIKL